MTLIEVARKHRVSHGTVFKSLERYHARRLAEESERNAHDTARVGPLTLPSKR